MKINSFAKFFVNKDSRKPDLTTSSAFESSLVAIDGKYKSGDGFKLIHIFKTYSESEGVFIGNLKVVGRGYLWVPAKGSHNKEILNGSRKLNDNEVIFLQKKVDKEKFGNMKF